MNFFRTVSRPNVKTFFKPDPGYILFDVDLAGADAQVVAWDAGDEPLKQAFRDYAAGKGPKVHCVNSKAIFGDLAGPDGKKDPYYSQAKAGVHLTNYYGQAKTCATALNVSLQRAEAFQRQWFKLHPAIKEWHHKVMRDLETTRTISNKFGFTRTFFDRINERLLPQALAWIPQCLTLDHEVLTKAGWRNLAEVDPAVEILTWSPDGSLTFAEATWHRGLVKELVEIPELNLRVTENHRVVCYTPENKMQVWAAGELKGQKRVPRGGFYSGDLSPSAAEIVYIAAFQADGCYDSKRDSISFEFQKERKIARLEAALLQLGVPFTKTVVRRGATCFYIPKGKYGLRPMMKQYGPWLLRLSGESLDLWLKELEFWDGWRSPQGELWFSSSVKENCEWVCTIAALRNLRARWMSADLRGARPNYRITIAPNKGKRTQVTTQRVTETVEVACPTVPSGFFLVRRGEEISVTGNSTVALIINYAYCEISENLPEIEILLQVHDSLTGQVPIPLWPKYKPLLREALAVTVPYDDPLVIPTSLKTSTSSWGECRPESWGD